VENGKMSQLISGRCIFLATPYNAASIYNYIHLDNFKFFFTKVEHHNN
jgi:hypothetical protein